MNKPVVPAIEETKARMQTVLEAQKRAQLKAGPPSAAKRKERLTRTIQMLVMHKDELTEAVEADFGARSRDLTMLADIAGAIGPLKYAREHLDAWMKPEKRKVSPA